MKAKSGQNESAGHSVARHTANNGYSRFGLNMLVFFVLLWGICFFTIFYTADVHQMLPGWVEELMTKHARSTGNDNYEALGSIFAEREFTYGIYDRRLKKPLKVSFKEWPDEEMSPPPKPAPKAAEPSREPAEKVAPGEQGADDGDDGAVVEERMKLAVASEDGDVGIRIRDVVLQGDADDGATGVAGNGHSGCIPSFFAHVKVDEIVVEKGEPLFYKKTEMRNGHEVTRRVFTPAFYRLMAYEKYLGMLTRRRGSMRMLLMNWVLAGLVMLALGFCMFSWRSNIFESANELALCGVCLVLHILCILSAHAVFKRLDGGPTFFLYALTPMALGPALVSNMIGKRVGLCAAILLSTLTPLIVDGANSYQLFVIALAYSVIGVLVFNNVRKRKNFIAGGVVMVVLVMLLCLMYVYRNGIQWVWGGFSPFWSTVAIYLSANALLTIVALFLLPFLFEMLFRVSTSITFNELCNGDHKLLERLREEAPGTYEHSMAVARLASAAAKAIGANSKMAEACALFHDIGKLDNPKDFAENLLMDDTNPHERLSPLESCAILRHHVSYGLELAAKAHLPMVIREAIGQHHGSSVMAGFYAKACAEAQVNGQKAPDIANYSYRGEIPWRKEVVLVSISDFCEAAIRSCMHVWEMPSYKLIFDKVVELIQERLKEHQFDKAQIQICEIDQVIRTLVDVFCSKYHLRPQYETAEEQVKRMTAQKPEGADEAADEEKEPTARQDGQKESPEGSAADGKEKQA